MWGSFLTERSIIAQNNLYDSFSKMCSGEQCKFGFTPKMKNFYINKFEKYWVGQRYTVYLLQDILSSPVYNYALWISARIEVFQMYLSRTSWQISLCANLHSVIICSCLYCHMQCFQMYWWKILKKKSLTTNVPWDWLYRLLALEQFHRPQPTWSFSDSGIARPALSELYAVCILWFIPE